MDYTVQTMREKVTSYRHLRNISRPSVYSNQMMRLKDYFKFSDWERLCLIWNGLRCYEKHSFQLLVHTS